MGFSCALKIVGARTASNKIMSGRSFDFIDYLFLRGLGRTLHRFHRLLAARGTTLIERDRHRYRRNQGKGRNGA